MPVNTTHPEYAAARPIWDDIRTAIKGTRAVKAAGETHLPRLYDQSPEEYHAFKLRAVWFGATAKTADGFVGIITRKPPNFTHPDTLQPFADDCDRKGTSLTTYAQAILRDLVEVGRCGTLVDWTEDATPYLTHYTAEQIINWKYRKMGAESVLAMVVLHEVSSEYRAETGADAPDQYETPQYDQWREFIIEGDTADTAVVTMKVHRRKMEKPKISKKESGEEFVVIEEKTLSRRAAPLRQIPFVIHTAANLSPEVCAKPILEDLAELNFAHYRASADLWNGRHLAGLPTPWAVGFTNETVKSLSLGTTRAWVTDNKDAKCGFLEMEGTALGSIKDGMNELEKQMGALGARAIEQEKKEAEAVGTVLLRARAESASLVTIAEQASNSLSGVMLWAAWITGSHASPRDEAANVYAVLPSDMTAGKMDSQTLTAFVQALQLGAMSFETFFHNLQAGELYPDARTLDDEQKAIEEGAPAPPLPELPPIPAGGPPAKA